MKSSSGEESVDEEPECPLEVAMRKMRELIEREDPCHNIRAPPPPLPRRSPLPEMGGGFREQGLGFSSRCVQGGGWHRDGFRDSGNMWLDMELGEGATPLT